MLDEKLETALASLREYVETDDWLVLKKALVLISPPSMRGKFSRRHPISKKQMTNDFEREIAARWSELTGRPVVFTNEHEEK
jgi:hypothetical protein